MKRKIGILLVSVLGLVTLVAGAGGFGILYLFWVYGRDLPDYSQLADYEPPVTTRVYAGDGRLLADYAVERRMFVPIRAIPRPVVQAFLAAEDKNFYSHPGVDLMGVVRAALTNLRNLGTSRRPVGASTITQQVAKNFLLTSEISLARKIKEAILSFRIERALTKDRILELYLNEIYLGYGSYGVAAAALNYFGKSLDELTLAEAAYLAALPKAPNNYHPVRNREAAIARRNWVIERMVEDGYAGAAEARAAGRMPLAVSGPPETEIYSAEYFAEEVRRELAQRYGERMLYEGGLAVRTTLSPRLQDIAQATLQEGLVAYDRHHGWRGSIDRIEPGAGWAERLHRVPRPDGLGAWRLAVALVADGEGAEIGFADGSTGRIPFAELAWARPRRDGQRLGPPVRAAADVLVPGDVVAVEAVSQPEGAKEGAAPYPPGTFALRQMPEIEGALVALDPHTGRVLAMAGGYSFQRSQFNRATQALRQPGSAFKPFVYLAALEAGLTPSTRVLDAPFVIDQGPGLGKWKPANYTNRFYGPSPMRMGIEKSRNLMTVRLAQTIGMERVASVAERFAVVDALEPRLSMALGAGETTLMRLTAAFAMLDNGGKRIEPTLIDRVQDRHGRTVFRHDARECPDCRAAVWRDQSVPEVADGRERLTDPISAYQIVSMLQGVVERGTGVRVKTVGKPLAGKTGTTNDSRDAWFVGFSPDLAVGVFVGFDEPRTLGPAETGSSVAAPIFRDFMARALADQPGIPFRIPPGVRLVRVDAESGLPAQPGDRNVLLEAFRPGTEPEGEVAVIDGGYVPAGLDLGTGGLY
ncbi:MAG: penicillin-binding protein 1A [Proteobacteria bacterium]|nr:penicillin-binding protein 1A [Pseudomonadota bacterium]